MSGYFKTVIAAVMFVSLVGAVLPKENAGKYVAFVSGLIVTAILISPVFKILDSVNFSLNDVNTKELKLGEVNYIMEEFEKNLAEKVEQELNDETKVTVYAKTDKNGEITGIEKVEIYPYSESAAQKVSELLDIEKNMVVEN